MYVLTVALSKYAFIFTLKLIISREKGWFKTGQKSSVFHITCKLV